jgi:hypothetical protein
VTPGHTAAAPAQATQFGNTPDVFTGQPVQDVEPLENARGGGARKGGTRCKRSGRRKLRCSRVAAGARVRANKAGGLRRVGEGARGARRAGRGARARDRPRGALNACVGGCCAPGRARRARGAQRAHGGAVRVAVGALHAVGAVRCALPPHFGPRGASGAELIAKGGAVCHHPGARRAEEARGAARNGRVGARGARHGERQPRSWAEGPCGARLRGRGCGGAEGAHGALARARRH